MKYHPASNRRIDSLFLSLFPLRRRTVERIASNFLYEEKIYRRNPIGSYGMERLM